MWNPWRPALAADSAVHGRVGSPGCPGPPLTEPDLWTAHPAPQVDCSKPGKKAWPETVATGFLRFHSDNRLTMRS